MLILTLLSAIAVTGRLDDRPVSLASAIADAEWAYSKAVPYPVHDPAFLLAYTDDGLRYALHRFGNSRQARVQLARNAFRHCDFAVTLQQLDILGMDQTALYAEARRRKRLLSILTRCFPGSSVADFQPVPGTGRWLVYYGVGPGEAEPAIRLTEGRVVLVQFDRSAVHVVGRPMRLKASQWTDGQTGLAYVMKLSPSSKGLVGVVVRGFPAAGCTPAEADLFSISSNGLRRLIRFKGLTYCTVVPPKGKAGLTVLVDNVYKAFWPDAYEYRDGRFRLANWRHPGLYEGDMGIWWGNDADHYYPISLWAASVDDICGRYSNALGEWRRAERTLRKTMTAQDHDDYHDSRFFGDDWNITLREVEQRIRWLSRRQYHHALLYRPFDFGIEVSPHRIGRGRGSSE